MAGTKIKNNCLIALLIAVGIYCSGCGLKYPDIKEFPCKRFRKVVVKDYDTKNPIENANVGFAISKWENWMVPCMFSRAEISEPQNVPMEDDIGIEFLKGIHIGCGTYTIESKIKCGWIQNFFPIVSPLGWTLYDTYIGSLCVKAPGYMSISISDDKGHWLRKEGAITVYEDFRNEVKSTFVILKKDHVEILLPKAGKKLKIINNEN